MAKGIELKRDVRRGKVVVGVPGEAEVAWKKLQEMAEQQGYLTSVNTALSDKVVEAIVEIRAALTAQSNGRTEVEADR